MGFRLIKNVLVNMINKLWQRIALLSCSFMQPNIDSRVDKVQSLMLLTSSGNVYRSYLEGRTVYLRFIRKHSFLPKYIREVVDDYFDLILCKCNQDWKTAARSDLDKADCFRRVQHLTRTFRNNISRIRDRSFLDYEAVGFPSLRDKGFDANFVDFIKYINGELIDYEHNRGVQTDGWQSFRLNLQLGTKALAKVLGLTDLVPDLCIKRIEYLGVIRVASVMEDAGGKPAYDVPIEERARLTSQFVRSLTNLEYFDGICYQTDHKLKNYNVLCTSGDGIDSVSAFDNDCFSTFRPISLFPTKTSLNKGFQPVVRHGKLNRPFIDKEFFRIIDSVSYDDVSSALNSILRPQQIRYVFKRIKMLDAAVKRAIEIDPHTVIDFGETDSLQRTLHRQDESAFGTTYLAYYLQADEKTKYPK